MKAYKRKHIENSVKSESNIEVFNLSNYESPIITEEYGKDYITYGAYNSYFTYLQDRYYGSPTNSAIITSVGQQMYGKGLAAINEDSDMIGWAKVEQLLKPKDLRSLCLDYKLNGQAALQLGVQKGKIVKAIHQPIETLAKGKKNDMGEVENYYYSADFSNTAKYPAKKIQAFGFGKSQNQILYIGGYTPGLMYYSKVDYHSGLQSAETEEEMSNFHLTNVKNGFSPSIMINFNNGDPGEKVRHKIKRGILKEWTGSGGSKVAIAFNEDAQNATTIDAVPIQKPHDQYSFLSTEAQDKILTSHRITSPLMIGIKDAAGFSSNAEELKVSFQLWNATVIRPFQDVILDSLQEILLFNGWNFDIYFENLQPIEFTDGGIDSTTDTDEVEKETGVEMSAEDYYFEDLEGNMFDVREYNTDAPEGYDFREFQEVGDEDSDLNYEALYNELNLASTQHNPRSKSSQDSLEYKVRYVYTKSHISQKDPSRRECTTLMGLSGLQKYWKKEDIVALAKRGYGKQYKHEGQSYQDIWRWKMGRYCHHKWMRAIFQKSVLNKNKVSVADAKRAGFRPETNDTMVSIAPIATPSKGVYKK